MNTWSRDLEAETKRMGNTWGQLESQPRMGIRGELLLEAYAPAGAKDNEEEEEGGRSP